MAIAEYTATARLRGRPSGKVTATKRQRGGRGHCRAGALHRAGGDQPGLAGGQPAEQRREREDQQPGDEDPAAPQ
jgi:hypothetical protein